MPNQNKKELNLKNFYSNRKTILLALFILALIVTSIFFFAKHRSSSRSPDIIPSSNPSIYSSPSDQAPTSATDNVNSSSTAANKVPNNVNSSGSLKPPTGNFVSNHRPSISGTQAPSSETSVCNTNVGAVCYIKFTNTSTGTVKQLQSQTIAANGSTFWDWDVNKAGLTQGSWTITVIATLGDQVQSAQDSLSLEVSP